MNGSIFSSFWLLLGFFLLLPLKRKKKYADEQNNREKKKDYDKRKLFSSFCKIYNIFIWSLYIYLLLNTRREIVRGKIVDLIRNLMNSLSWKNMFWEQIREKMKKIIFLKDTLIVERTYILKLNTIRWNFKNKIH